MVAPFDVKTIRQIDAVLHEPSRLCIAFALNLSDVLSFSELKALLGMTDGNLSVHLRTLEEKGYVATHRTSEAGKPRKLCRLSGRGRTAFKEYLAILDQILLAARVTSNGGGPSPPGGGPRGGTLVKEA